MPCLKRPAGILIFTLPFLLALTDGAHARVYRSLPKDAGVHHLETSKRAGRDGRFSVSVPVALDFKKRRPLLVVLHGSKNNAENYIKDWANEVGRDDTVVLAPNAASEEGDWSTRDSGRVLRLISRAEKAYRIDRDRVFVAGFSSGGWMAWYLGLRYPSTFRAVAVLAGRMNPGMIEEARSRHRKNPSFLILAPAKDEYIPIEGVRERVQEMKAARMDVRFEEFQTGHGSPIEFLVLTLDWLDQFT